MKTLTRVKPRWLVAAGLLLCALVVLVFGVRQLGQPPDAAWQRIQAQKVFVVASDASYPPFESLDANGALFGFDVDLADEIGRRWGVQVHYENITYDALLGALVAGRDDAVISAFVPQPDRTREVSYTGAYFTSGTVVVVKQDAPRGQDPGSDPTAWASGKTLAVEYGGDGDALARQWERQLAGQLAGQTGGITILRKSTPADALLAVENRQADAALVDAISAYDFLMSHPALRLAGPPLNPEQYVIAVNVKSTLLLRQLEQTLAAMQADGTLTALKLKWFGKAGSGN
jgi:ABC-type amino acid transport substrate-binding protein